MVAALPPSREQQSEQPPVFIDLGSGLGRVVLQAALLCGARFSRYVGLELSSSRLEQAEHVLARLREEAGRKADVAASDALVRVDFYEEDVTQSHWLDQASHVFICSTAFGAVACRQIVERLAASDR
jgi:tRNA G46 methylase TrmB